MDAVFFSREEGRIEEAKNSEQIFRSVCVKWTAFEGVFQLSCFHLLSCVCFVLTRTYLCIPYPPRVGSCFNLV